MLSEAGCGVLYRCQWFKEFSPELWRSTVHLIEKEIMKETNLIEILTRTSISLREVMFTSYLSFVLNPEGDHGLHDQFLSKFLKSLTLKYDSDAFTVETEVQLEYQNKSCGRVDLLLRSKEVIVAIEAKIRDSSASNTDSNGVGQLKRYSQALDSNNIPWYLVYLIPDLPGAQCKNQLKAVPASHLINNIFLMPWKTVSNSDKSKYDFNWAHQSVAQILEDLRFSEDLWYHEWLSQSVHKSIEKLESSAAEESKFPSEDDLQPINTWRIFNEFKKVAKISIRSAHSTIGVPFGFGDGRVDNIFKNSTYRIRTTKKYYTKKSEKLDNLPRDYVEVEIRPELYGECATGLAELGKKFKISGMVLMSGQHINRIGNEDVMLFRIPHDTELRLIYDLDAVLRMGFKALIRKALNIDN
jgi:hypothetical protein